MWTCRLIGGPQDGQTVESYPARRLLLAMDDRGHYELETPPDGQYDTDAMTYRWTGPVGA